MACLKQILKEVESGELEISSKYEDIHSFVEANLIDRIGDAGKKLHTGRSRNDQVALDMKLYVRDEITEIDALVKEVLVTLEKNHGREHSHLYAGIHPSAESTADHTGTSHGRIF